MRKIVNYIKSISNKNRLIVISAIMLFSFVIFLGKSFAQLTPVRSVSIFSENSLYENEEASSFKITKSAKWISRGKAEITLNIDSQIMPNNKYTDIILVLDTSGSMNENRLNQVKNDTIELVNYVIPKESNVALVTFNDTSEIISEFTNDITILEESINSLTALGNTNYYQALVNVDNILKNYTFEKNRDCVVLFLTDGLPNIDSPNEISQYEYLKSTYPLLVINTIQYEMGSESVEILKQISDYQYIADSDTLNKFLYRAAVNPVPYENFEIIDYIESKYFNVSDVSSIEITSGTVALDENKVSWSLDSLRTGLEEKMIITVDLKDELIGVGGVYPTNNKLEIKSSVRDYSEDISSTLTPILSDNYKIIYDSNAPNGCSVTGVPNAVNASVFDIVTINAESPSCEGYKFKDWELVSDNVTKVNADYFVMPEEDVIVRATWSKLSAAKSMDGKVSKVQNLYEMMANNSVPDNVASQFVTNSKGIIFGSPSSDTNGKGIYKATNTISDEYPIYYYRGVVNNNLLFADKCWKIVRTTNTGGVKLVYNGDATLKYNEELNKITFDKYVNVSNDRSFPYIYDDTTQQWISTNKTDRRTATISFSISVPGNYVLSYDVSSEAEFDFAKFYKDGVQVGAYSGIVDGNLFLGELTAESIITVKYVKDDYTSSGTDTVSFNLSRVDSVDDDKITRSCSNPSLPYINSDSLFNTKSNSIAYNGYMYGDVYEVSSLRADIVGIGNKTETYVSSASSTNYIYSSSVSYDNNTGLYTLIDGENRLWSDTYSIDSGNQFLYTCLSETENTCEEVYYVTDSTSSSSIYYVTFNGGEMASDIVDRDIIYGNDVSYDTETGMYTLVSTMKSSISDWPNDFSTITSNYHYTCFNDSGVCDSVKYIYYASSISTRSYGTFNYTVFGNGIDVDEAVKQMTTESKNIIDSNVKTVIDNWYEINLINYTNELEDTIWCSDRNISSYGSWVKDSSDSYRLFYGSNTGFKFLCSNINDSFTVNDTESGNGDLIYPIALLTQHELNYAGATAIYSNRSFYLYTGTYWWTMTPYAFGASYIMSASNFYLNYDGRFDDGSVNGFGYDMGVRPSISLKYGARSIDGDGTAEDPFIVEVDDNATISFIVNGDTYYASEGMTWYEWTTSAYEAGGVSTSYDAGSLVYDDSGYVFHGITSDSVIIAGENYSTK